MRELKTTSENILSLISCARDYGFEDDILFIAFSDMLGNKLSSEEIEEYSRGLLLLDGTSLEDYESVKEILINFKKEYCN